jgi:acylphosphatase
VHAARGFDDRGVARFRFVVNGVVQGVGFRAATRSAATRLGVVGFVRNRADGAVEGEAEGADEALARFRAWLQKGPAFAAVERVEWLPLAAPRDAPAREAAFTVVR